MRHSTLAFPSSFGSNSINEFHSKPLVEVPLRTSGILASTKGVQRIGNWMQERQAHGWLALHLEVQNGILQKHRSISCLQCPYWNTRRPSKIVIVFPMSMLGSTPTVIYLPYPSKIESWGPAKGPAHFSYISSWTAQREYGNFFSNIYVRTKKSTVHSACQQQNLDMRHARCGVFARVIAGWARYFPRHYWKK